MIVKEKTGWEITYFSKRSGSRAAAGAAKSKTKAITFIAVKTLA